MRLSNENGHKPVKTQSDSADSLVGKTGAVHHTSAPVPEFDSPAADWLITQPLLPSFREPCGVFSPFLYPQGSVNIPNVFGSYPSGYGAGLINLLRMVQLHHFRFDEGNCVIKQSVRWKWIATIQSGKDRNFTHIRNFQSR